MELVAEADQGDIVEPAFLTCSITHALFRDPVVTHAGHTYERSALQQAWRTFEEARDPLTNARLENMTLVTNWSMRQQARVDGRAEGNVSASLLLSSSRMYSSLFLLPSL